MNPYSIVAINRCTPLSIIISPSQHLFSGLLSAIFTPVQPMMQWLDRNQQFENDVNWIPKLELGGGWISQLSIRLS